MLISGIQALVRLTLDQRRLDCRRGLDTGVYVSGYPGSPLGGLDREFQRNRRFLDPAHVVFHAGVNEELAATAVAGTQLIGELRPTPTRRRGGLLVREEPGVRPRRGCDQARQRQRDRAAGRRRRGDRRRPRLQVLDHPQLVEPMAAASSCRCSRLAVSASCSRSASTRCPVARVGPVGRDQGGRRHRRRNGDRRPRRAPRSVPRAWPAWSTAARRGCFRQPRLTRRRTAEPQAGARRPSTRRRPAQPHRLRASSAAHRRRRVRHGLPSGRRGRSTTSASTSTLSTRRRCAWRRFDAVAARPVVDARRLAAGVEEIIVIEDKLPFVESLLKERSTGCPARRVILGKEDEAGRPLRPRSRHRRRR